MPRVLLVAAALVLLSCSSGGNAASYGDAQALAGALNSSGIACTTFEDVPSPDVYAETQGKCTFAGETVELWTFKDSGARRNFLGASEVAVCAFGIAAVAFIEGDRWIVWPETETAARDIADAFAGDVRVRECED